MARCLVTSTQCFHSLDSYQTAGCLKRYARVDVTYPDGESYEYLPGGPVTVMAHAKYQQIADRLRDQISSGALAPGERLPSEPDLVRDYDASRNTVRLAIALLTNQGLVVTRQGLGTFVLEPSRPYTALLSRAADSAGSPHVCNGLT